MQGRPTVVKRHLSMHSPPLNYQNKPPSNVNGMPHLLLECHVAVIRHHFEHQAPAAARLPTVRCGVEVQWRGHV